MKRVCAWTILGITVLGLLVGVGIAITQMPRETLCAFVIIGGVSLWVLVAVWAILQIETGTKKEAQDAPDE